MTISDVQALLESRLSGLENLVKQNSIPRDCEELSFIKVRISELKFIIHLIELGAMVSNEMV